MTIYMNDANGLRPPWRERFQMGHIWSDCEQRICSHLIKADRCFLAQNISTHVAQIAEAIRSRDYRKFQTVVISDHEIGWIKEMLEIPGYQPDSTRSNHAANAPVSCPTFSVKVASFSAFIEAVEETDGPVIFFISHVSRLTGEIADVKRIFRAVKSQNPNSILIVDGAQSLGVLERLVVDEVCDVYLGTSSKFLGAEPTLGFAFFSSAFNEKYIRTTNYQYPRMDPDTRPEDLRSLWENLWHPLFNPDYSRFNQDRYGECLYAETIADLKIYAVARLQESAPSRLYLPANQSPGFLTLDFGSKDGNLAFVAFAAEQGLLLSDNDGWSIIPAPLSLVRASLSVRTDHDHIHRLAELAAAWPE